MSSKDEVDTGGSTDIGGTTSAQRNIARDNHFVPQGLLRRWSDDGQTLYAYSLLVPDARVPEWEQKPIKSLAMRTNFYTVNRDGSDSDTTERWFAEEFEQPGIEASQRLIDGARPSRDDWHAIIRLYALQEVRTPQSFLEAVTRYDDLIPPTLKGILDDVGTYIANGIKLEDHIRMESDFGEAFSGAVKLELIDSPTDDGKATLTAKVTVGRAFWITMMKGLLESKAMEKLLRHPWHILQPAGDATWPITDHPSLRLGYRSRTDFTFQAGFAQRGADLMMPLSPRHLLHVQVGKTERGIIKVDQTMTNELRYFLVARAYRQVFASAPTPWVVRQRPRTVDKKRFELERDQWLHWHERQSVVEFRSL